MPAGTPGGALLIIASTQEGDDEEEAAGKSVCVSVYLHSSGRFSLRCAGVHQQECVFLVRCGVQVPVCAFQLHFSPECQFGCESPAVHRKHPDYIMSCWKKPLE